MEGNSSKINTDPVSTLSKPLEKSTNNGNAEQKVMRGNFSKLGKYARLIGAAATISVAALAPQDAQAGNGEENLLKAIVAGGISARINGTVGAPVVRTVIDREGNVTLSEDNQAVVIAIQNAERRRMEEEMKQKRLAEQMAVRNKAVEEIKRKPTQKHMDAVTSNFFNEKNIQLTEEVINGEKRFVLYEPLGNTPNNNKDKGYFFYPKDENGNPVKYTRIEISHLRDAIFTAKVNVTNLNTLQTVEGQVKIEYNPIGKSFHFIR